MNSAVYSGWVRHRRFTSPAHQFRYGLTMLYVDLAEVDEIFTGRFWSAAPGRWAPGWFRRSDYLPPPFSSPGEPLDAAVRRVVETHTGRRPVGPVRVLTHPRYWGVQFNPATFWYCFDESGTGLEAVVVEVTNTPWLERHCYVLDARPHTPDARVTTATSSAVRSGRSVVTASHEKAFHVSPFLDMDQKYHWALSVPSDMLTLHVANRRVRQGSPTERIFDATVELDRRPWSARERDRLLWRHPPATLKVLAGIYWQAVRLRLRGARYVPHPGRHVADPSPITGSEPLFDGLADGQATITRSATGKVRG